MTSNGIGHETDTSGGELLTEGEDNLNMAVDSVNQDHNDEVHAIYL